MTITFKLCDMVSFCLMWDHVRIFGIDASKNHFNETSRTLSKELWQNTTTF